ncbi:UPF0262 family protein [Ensifer adhaerens]
MSPAEACLCDASLDRCGGRPGPRIEREQALAVIDLLENNSFLPVGHEGGLYLLKTEAVKGRLVLHTADGGGTHFVLQSKAITVPDIGRRKGNSPIVCPIADTTPIAGYVDTHCELALVADSVGTGFLGLPSTLGVTVETMILHGKAVRRRFDRARNSSVAGRPIASDHTPTLSVALSSPPPQGHSAAVEHNATAAAFFRLPFAALRNAVSSVQPPRTVWLSSGMSGRQPPLSRPLSTRVPPNERGAT